jgi:hypothetical protein
LQRRCSALTGVEFRIDNRILSPRRQVVADFWRKLGQCFGKLENHQIAQDRHHGDVGI